MSLLSEITFEKKAIGSPALLEKLRKTGVALIPAFCTAEELVKLNGEFDRFLLHQESWIVPFDYSNGNGVRILMKDIDKTLYPETDRVFSQPFMERMTQDYFNDKEVHANQGIYIVRDIVGNKHHANDMHFDVQRSLKFFIYLTDTTAENGAFYCLPGSQVESGKLRQKLGDKISYENRELSRELPAKDTDLVPMEGPAGTLIIFDTDVFHRAGFVKNGERRVMRAYSTFVKTPLTKPSLLKRIFK